MTRNSKKIEKLRTKVAEINERMKSDLQQKNQYEKEIDELQNAEILAYIKSKKISVNDTFLLNLELAEKLNKSGIDLNEIEELIGISDNSVTVKNIEEDNDND